MLFKHLVVRHIHIQIISTARTQFCALVYKMSVRVVMESLLCHLCGVYRVAVYVIVYHFLRFAWLWPQVPWGCRSWPLVGRTRSYPLLRGHWHIVLNFNFSVYSCWRSNLSMFLYRLFVRNLLILSCLWLLQSLGLWDIRPLVWRSGPPSQSWLFKSREWPFHMWSRWKHRLPGHVMIHIWLQYFCWILWIEHNFILFLDSVFHRGCKNFRLLFSWNPSSIPRSFYAFLFNTKVHLWPSMIREFSDVRSWWRWSFLRFWLRRSYRSRWSWYSLFWSWSSWSRRRRCPRRSWGSRSWFTLFFVSWKKRFKHLFCAISAHTKALSFMLWNQLL